MNERKTVLPLPFSKITVRFDDYGVVSSKAPPRVKSYQKEIDCGILDRNIYETLAAKTVMRHI